MTSHVARGERSLSYHLLPLKNQQILKINVVKNLPADKSPGPDGFNNEFNKSCWDIIKTDVFELIMAFHAGNVNLDSINSSFITLVPKKRCHFLQMISDEFLC